MINRGGKELREQNKCDELSKQKRSNKKVGGGDRNREMFTRLGLSLFAAIPYDVGLMKYFEVTNTS
jgi:hypothetical protein